MFPESNPAPGFEKHPEHEVKAKLFKGSVTIKADGVEIGSSNQTVLVTESNHAPIYYLPIDDIKNEHLVDSNHVTRCPFKGKARYWNVRVGNHEIDNAVWGYETPYDEVLELAGLVAFFPNKVEITAIPA